jgi:hypothetical protein
MKKLSLLFLSFVVLLSSCDKDEDENQIQISGEEAAAIIASSIGADDAGLITIFSDALDVVNEVTAESTGGRLAASCGSSDVLSWNSASQPGETPSYSFGYEYGWTLTCDGTQQPSILALSIAYDGNLTSEDFNTTYDGGGELTVTGLLAEQLVFNGLYNQDISYSIVSEGQQYSGTHKLVYTLTNVTMTKETEEIVSGSAALILSGTSNQGVYSITANITYNGDGTATVVINGQAYGVDLSTGMVNG